MLIALGIIAGFIVAGIVVSFLNSVFDTIF